MEVRYVSGFGAHAERNRFARVKQKKNPKGPNGFGRDMFHINRMLGAAIVQIEQGPRDGSRTSRTH